MTEASELILGTDHIRMGETLMVRFLAGDPECIHTLEVWILGSRADRLTNLGTGLDWKVPDYTEYCPDVQRMSCELQCRTYLRGACLGMRSRFVTLELPEGGRILNDRIRLGEETALKLSRVPRAYTMDLSLLLGRQTVAIASGFRGERCPWTPELELAAAFPADIQIPAVLRCRSRNGRADLGFRDTPVTLEVPENDRTRPRIGAVTLRPLGNGVPAPFDALYLSGRTGLQAEAELRSDCSAIAQVTIRAGDQQASGLQIPVLDRAGELPVTITARDRRGYEGRWTGTIGVLPYQKPRVVPAGEDRQVVCSRCNAQGALDPRGTFLAIRAGRKYAPVHAEGTDRNRCTLRWRIRGTGETDFGPWQVLLQEDAGENTVSLVLSDVVRDPKKSYQAELSAVDLLGEEHRLAFGIMTEAVSFALYDGVDGAAFGKYPEEPHVVDLAEHMVLRVRGRLQVQGEAWKSLGLNSAVKASHTPRGRCSTSGCRYRVSAGNRVSICFNCAFTYSGMPVSVSLLPLPGSLRPGCRVTGLCPAESGTAQVCTDETGRVWIQQVDPGGSSGWIDGWLEYFL